MWSAVGTDVFGPDGVGSAQLGDKLLGVQPDLNDIVQECEEGGQGEGGDKEGDETELDDCRGRESGKGRRVRRREAGRRETGNNPSWS